MFEKVKKKYDICIICVSLTDFREPPSVLASMFYNFELDKDFAIRCMIVFCFLFCKGEEEKFDSFSIDSTWTQWLNGVTFLECCVVKLNRFMFPIGVFRYIKILTSIQDYEAETREITLRPKGIRSYFLGARSCSQIPTAASKGGKIFNISKVAIWEWLWRQLGNLHSMCSALWFEILNNMKKQSLNPEQNNDVLTNFVYQY
jgi:hypothetical protein